MATKGKRGTVGFPGKGDVATETDHFKDGYRKLEADLDPHDRERNPVGGLKNKTSHPDDLVDRDNDRDNDGRGSADPVSWDKKKRNF